MSLFSKFDMPTSSVMSFDEAQDIVTKYGNTRISVRTERLLEKTSSRSEIILLIHVKTKQLQVLVGTIGFP